MLFEELLDLRSLLIRAGGGEGRVGGGKGKRGGEREGMDGKWTHSGLDPVPLLYFAHVYGHVIPRVSGRSNGMDAGQPDIVVYLVLCCLMGCCTWLDCYVFGTVTSRDIGSV